MTEPPYWKIVVEIQHAKKATFWLIYLISVKVARINYFIGKKSPPSLCVSCVLITISLPMGCIGSALPFVPVLTAPEMDLCLFCH